MVTQMKLEQKSLYDTDYNLWVMETVKKLELGDFKSIDLENLIEEVASLSRSEKKAIESLLIRLFEHLLKLKYWQKERDYNQGHWEGEIINFRKQIKKELKVSPSLKRHLLEVFEECYQDGREIAAKRSQLPLNTFPASPIATIEQVLDEDWLA